MIDEIDVLQRGIDIQFQSFDHFRKAIIRSCRGHSAFAQNLFASFFENSVFIINLNFFIIIYEVVHRFLQHKNYVQFYNEGNEMNEKTYFVNRQYRGKSDARGRFGKKSGNFSSPRDKSRSTVEKSKRYFVCDKEKC